MKRMKSNRRRAIAFLKHRGVCHICRGKITPGERWELSHIVPLALGGFDDETNLAPAHYVCHREQTANKDLPAIAKSARIRQKHIGAWQSQSPMPCGRRSALSKTFNNGIVPRRSLSEKLVETRSRRAILSPIASLTPHEDRSS